MLDQIYGPARFAESATAEIRFTEESYCDFDGMGYSDHRPVVAVFPNMLARAVATVAEGVVPMATDSEAAAEESEWISQQSTRPGDSAAP